MSALKIGFVVDDTLDSTDGVQQYVLTLGDWLSKHGHEVHYLVGQTSRSDMERIHSLSKNIAVRFNGNRMSMPLPASRARIRKLLETEQFDILHIQMPYSPLLGARILRGAPPHTALVGTFHILPFSKLHQIAAKALSAWLRPTQKKLARIFSVSQPAQAFAAAMHITTTVLPNVVNYHLLAKQTSLPAYKDNYTIVFLGRLVERKGCMELLKAVKVLHDRQAIPKLQVLICGKGHYMPKLQAWVSAHHLQNIVTFVGFVSEADKARYLASADIAVFPSLGGESFGIVLLEAMAAGAGVVLGGNNPGYASVLTDTPEALFDPKDTTGFTSLLQRIHDNPKLAKALHTQQQAMVRQYDVAVVAPKLVSYYQASITNKDRR